MSFLEECELRGITNEPDKEIVSSWVEEVGFEVNEYNDLVVLVDIRIFDDNTRICEVLDEMVRIYDDELNVIHEYGVALEPKFIQQALEKCEELDAR